MATDNFLFIPPDKVETIALRFDVKPISNNILNEIILIRNLRNEIRFVYFSIIFFISLF
jgi:hypothetical protein